MLFVGSNEEEGKSGVFEDADQLIYPGARLTLMTSMLLIISFYMKHGLTADALSDLQVLLELHCMAPNICRKTTKLFKKFFMDLKSPIEYHYYCNHDKCFTYFGQVLPEACPSCGIDISEKKHHSYFVVVPIIYQLQALFTCK